MTRVIVFYHEEIKDDFFGQLGRCFKVNWPKAQQGEPISGDMLEVVKMERVLFSDGVLMNEARIRWRWKVLATERDGDNLIMAVA